MKIIAGVLRVIFFKRQAAEKQGSFNFLPFCTDKTITLGELTLKISAYKTINGSRDITC